MNQVKTSGIFRALTDADADYLRDESRRTGHAGAIAFPENAGALKTALREASAAGAVLTIQGSRTGIAGGAVPEGGAILNLARMDRILAARDGGGGAPVLVVEPGLTLRDLNGRLAGGDLRIETPDAETLACLGGLRDGAEWFFAPDPTETSASLGGMAACNASGACSFRYGPTRRHVRGLTVMLPDAQTLTLRRGRERCRGLGFVLETREGRVIAGELPDYTLPSVKNAAGYHALPDMDMLDLWIGAEGTLGVLAALELQLTRRPLFRWGVTAFFDGDAEALDFIGAVRGGHAAARTLPGAPPPAAIEFFDCRTLELIARDHAGAGTPGREWPVPPPGAGAAVYVELHAAAGEEAAEALERLAADVAACGGDDAATWIADTPSELERLRLFRHAAPELVNIEIDKRRRREPGITKLGTDMAVPPARAGEALAMFRRGLEERGLDYVVFGHAGDNHFHVNILPATVREYEEGRRLYVEWAHWVIAWGGSIAAEHGIGKLKKALLREMLGDAGIAGMRSVRGIFDPDERFNRGNLFDNPLGSQDSRGEGEA